MVIKGRSRRIGRVGKAIVSLSLVMSLQGCAVYMALNGEKEPNFNAFDVGSARWQVELQLGRPVSSVTSPDGKRTDVYEYEVGNEPSGGRASWHAGMDLMTLGMWEPFGTLFEVFQGRKRRVSVVHGSDGRVLEIIKEDSQTSRRE